MTTALGWQISSAPMIGKVTELSVVMDISYAWHRTACLVYFKHFDNGMGKLYRKSKSNIRNVVHAQRYRKGEIKLHRLKEVDIKPPNLSN